uniref:Uncharacterized protein n=1 Tax=Mustela putorius furo TaxID=9669 RepID=M3YCB4_MUSPF
MAGTLTILFMYIPVCLAHRRYSKLAVELTDELMLLLARALSPHWSFSGNGVLGLYTSPDPASEGHALVPGYGFLSITSAPCSSTRFQGLSLPQSQSVSCPKPATHRNHNTCHSTAGHHTAQTEGPHRPPGFSELGPHSAQGLPQNQRRQASWCLGPQPTPSAPGHQWLLPLGPQGVFSTAWMMLSLASCGQCPPFAPACYRVPVSLCSLCCEPRCQTYGTFSLQD